MNSGDVIFYQLLDLTDESIIHATRIINMSKEETLKWLSEEVPLESLLYNFANFHYSEEHKTMRELIQSLGSVPLRGTSVSYLLRPGEFIVRHGDWVQVMNNNKFTTWWNKQIEENNIEGELK